MADKDFYQMSMGISKALTALESPLKTKHARIVIICTHRMKETHTFWKLITRQPLMEHRFTAWKFCHLLHKVLREGHESALKHSQSHKKMILEMGKLWGHLQDGVGVCIQAYSKLLVTKLDFHEKNCMMTGSLNTDFKEIEKITENDINIFFQLCVEILDYLDDILQVQSKVLNSLIIYRTSSMTPQGQCRLAPLIPLIQDCNALYDLCVRVMFKLHNALPSDTLSGHRDRFKNMFIELKRIYDNIRPLQYFDDLIQLPHLPETAPNFSSKSDYGNYKTPVVVVVQQEIEQPVDDLVDTNFVSEEPTSQENSEVVKLQQTINDKDSIIEHLESELVTQNESYNILKHQYHTNITQKNDELYVLTNELKSTRNICSQLLEEKEELSNYVSDSASIVQKISEEEEKHKQSIEKFTKLKTMYTQIRDEHIVLLRQHGETSKTLAKEKSINSNLVLETEQLNNKIKKLETDLLLNDKLRQENIDLKDNVEEYIKSNKMMETAYEELKHMHNNDISSKSLEIEKLNSDIISYKSDIAQQKVYEEKIMTLDKQLNDLKKINLQSQEDRKNESEKLKGVIDSKSNELEESRHQFKNELKKKDDDINSRILKAHNLEIELKGRESTIEKLQSDISSANSLIDNLNKHIDELQIMSSEYKDESKSLEILNQELKTHIKTIIVSNFTSIMSTLENLLYWKMQEQNLPVYDKLRNILDVLHSTIIEITTQTRARNDDPSLNKDLINKSIKLLCENILLIEQCTLVYKTTSDLDNGEGLYELLHKIGSETLNFFKVLKLVTSDNIIGNAQIIISYIEQMHALINVLEKSSSSNIEIGDLIGNELEEMDKSIREAADKIIEMLSASRKKDNGIKLEVNEKILDACTSLMECIMQLIKRSRYLQEEIVATGRGKTSVKDFYKRNSQWTEGLISASKSVAKAANYLVDAANKAVTTDSNSNFEIIVAAQEIAASTAQLVIASKVKAQKSSQKLSDLTTASKNVTQATGFVVATVKDCNNHLEQVQDVDVSKLTSSQAKTMEMEIHVKVLELEQALQLERLKLASFRRNHYRNAE